MDYKIFCCSDTHGSVLPSPLEPVSTYLHAGDFYNRQHTKNRTLYADKLDVLTNSIESVKVPTYSVLGNHDVRDDALFFRKFNISGKTIRLAEDILLFGIGWSGTDFFELPEEKEIKQVIELAKESMNKIRKDNDRIIIISHYPYMLDGFKPVLVQGWLFQCIKELIDELKPIVFISGHVHEFFGQHHMYSETLCIFPGNLGGILSINDDKAEFLQYTKEKLIPNMDWSHSCFNEV